MNREKYTIDDLLMIMKKLRSDNGCPWDRAQTHDSIKSSMIEESYEVIDAIDKHDDKMMANELGDLLLQIVFHSEIASERGKFDFLDVTDEISRKLISRHSHVFGSDSAGDAETVLDLWDKNKKEEKGFLSATDTLRDVPESFASLMRAQKVLKRAKKSGMEFSPDFGNEEDILNSIIECASDMKKDIANGADGEDGLKKLLLLNAALGMVIGKECEILLKKSVDEFIEKFSVLEQVAQQN